MQAVIGTYHDEERAAAAIEALVQESVPLDEISILVAGDAETHRIPIVERAQVAKGAIRGSVIGALLGAIGGTLAATGVFVGPGMDILASGPVLTLVRAIAGAGGLGYGIGVLSALSFWRDEADLHGEDLATGAALVVVHSDDLHDKAREVFVSTQADRITG